jgi:hypothetical protein
MADVVVRIQKKYWPLWQRMCSLLKKLLFTPQTVLQLNLIFRPPNNDGREKYKMVVRKKQFLKLCKHLQKNAPILLKSLKKLKLKVALDPGRKNGGNKRKI